MKPASAKTPETIKRVAARAITDVFMIGGSYTDSKGDSRPPPDWLTRFRAAYDVSVESYDLRMRENA